MPQIYAVQITKTNDRELCDRKGEGKSDKAGRTHKITENPFGLERESVPMACICVLSQFEVSIF